jgi:hypothetical protein
MVWSARDLLLTVAGGVMLLVAVWLLLSGGGMIGGAEAGAPPPALTLIAPVSGASVSGPLVLRFRADNTRLLSSPSGWGANGFHLHASINGVEVMPAPADILPSDGEYSWTLENPPVGEVTVQLLWSDGQHRAVGAGASQAASVTVR